MPVSSEYFEGSLNVIDRNMLTESRDSIIKLYPNIVLQLDYQDIFFEHPEYFYNPDHPNPVGANIVSGMIRADLEYLGIND